MTLQSPATHHTALELKPSPGTNRDRASPAGWQHCSEQYLPGDCSSSNRDAEEYEKLQQNLSKAPWTRP